MNQAKAPLLAPFFFIFFSAYFFLFFFFFFSSVWAARGQLEQ
jgi:hypothetical protein